MRNFFIILLLSTFLYAQNPIAFAALGDVIYNNVEKIDKLKNINEYKIYSKKIDQYVSEVKKCKKDGYGLELGSTAKKRMAYLNRLRELVKTNDFFVRLVNSSYETARESNNSRLFSQIINSGLLQNIDEHKKEIIDYYLAHQEDMNTTGLIAKYLAEDEKLRAKREAQLRRYKSKKEREAERIRKIRENDKRQREAIEKKLQEELMKKKKRIREEQREELSKTI